MVNRVINKTGRVIARYRSTYERLLLELLNTGELKRDYTRQLFIHKTVGDSYPYSYKRCWKKQGCNLGKDLDSHSVFLSLSSDMQ